MANFDQAYRRVLANEGGYVNDPEDVGGETYKGIARNFYPSWAGWYYLDLYKSSRNTPIPTNAVIDSAPLEASVQGFYRGLWRKYRMEEINSQAIAENLFDFIVLAKRAVATMQEALKQLGFRVAVDNIIGPQTIGAINKANPEKLNNLFVKKRITYHQTRVKAGLVNGKFLAGWIKRAKTFSTGTKAGLLVALLLIGGGALLAKLRRKKES